MEWLKSRIRKLVSPFRFQRQLDSFRVDTQNSLEGILTQVRSVANDLSDIAERRLNLLDTQMESVTGELVGLSKRLEEAEISLEEAEISLEEVEIKFQSQHDAAMKEFAAIQRILLKAPPGKSSSKSKPADFRIEEIGEVASQSIYASIENQFRGSEDFLLNQQRSYVKLIQGLPDKGTVVDLGCGRGEFLSLLSETGIKAIGVDQDALSISKCEEEGLDVVNDDLLNFLSSLEDRSVRAVVLFQVLEHLSFNDLTRVLVEAYRVLMPGGMLLGETPNGANLSVGGSTFWLDHTHVRPLHPELLSHLAEFYGYVNVQVELVSVPQVPWALDSSMAGDSIADAVLGLQGYILSGRDALLVAYRGNDS